MVMLRFNNAASAPPPPPPPAVLGREWSAIQRYTDCETQGSRLSFPSVNAAAQRHALGAGMY